MKRGDVRTTACEWKPITPRDSSAYAAPTRRTSCAADPALVLGGVSAAYARAPTGTASSATSTRPMNAAPKRLCSNEFFEGVLEDLGGLAPEEQALVAADLAAQVHQLVAQRGGFLELEVGGGLAHLALDLLGHRFGDLARQVLGSNRIGGIGSAVRAADEAEDVVDFFADRLGLDAVLEVERHLGPAPTARLAECFGHRLGDHVGVHDDHALDVARSAPDRLDQRRPGAEVAFLVGVEDADQRDFGQIEPFAQQIDPDQHVELALAQVAQDRDALQRLDLAVQVAHADPVLDEILGEILGHLLC